MATFKLRANELSGQTGLSVRLYAEGGSSIANGAGGDSLSETGSSDGQFTATVAETLSGAHDFYVYQSGNAIYYGKVDCTGNTWNADTARESVVVIPLTGTVHDRASGTTISLYVGETGSVSIAVVDADGDAVDLTGLTLTVVFESRSKTDIVEIADADITVSSSTISFDIPALVTTAPATWLWSLRSTTSVLLAGNCLVDYAASAD